MDETYILLKKLIVFIYCILLGYELLMDGKTCIYSESFLIFSRNEHIGILSKENTHYSDQIPLTGLKDAR